MSRLAVIGSESAVSHKDAITAAIGAGGIEFEAVFSAFFDLGAHLH